MLINDLIQLVVNTQAKASCVPLTVGGPSSCPGTTLNAITAAFATQGYWMQADILSFFLDSSTGSGYQMWAVLAYIVSAAGGLVAMGMGQPPKMWLWFFIGPALFHFLIDDRVPAHGTRWNVGPLDADPDPTKKEMLQRANRAQNYVWKLSETGLANTNIAQAGVGKGKEGYEISASKQPSGGINGDGTVMVSQLFSYFDLLISQGLVEPIIEVMGLYHMGPTKASADNKTNLPTEESFKTFQDELSDVGTTVNTDPRNDESWLLSNLKWRMLQDISGARLQSGDLRDAFATFLTSECGDAFSKGIDQAKFTAAATSKGRNVPNSVFISGQIQDLGGIINLPMGHDYTLVTQLLKNQSIPTPKSMQTILSDYTVGSFARSADFFTSAEFFNGNYLENIRCDQYLYFLTHAFRWQAGHIYYQMVSSLPLGIPPANLPYNLFYGWDIIQDDKNNPRSWVDEILNGGKNYPKLLELGAMNQARYLMDLILVHTYKNEFTITKPVYETTSSAGKDVVDNTNTYTRTVGSVSKFGEVYQWSLLLPYMQGVLLYLLAMAYPFCCIMVVMPGRGKIIFTWMTFWVWAKIWDIGFAICMVLERSVWAMIGNGSDASRLLSRVLDIQTPFIGTATRLSCPDPFGGAATLLKGGPLPGKVCGQGIIPNVFTGTPNGVLGATFGALGDGATPGNLYPWFNSLRTLDISMTLGASMDLDLSNSYYIYIMAALYFAVPAITGQLVLGAKAGAASLLQTATGGTAQEAGRGAGSAYTGSTMGAVNANQQVLGHNAYLKSMRNDPEKLAENALNYGNAAGMQDIAGKLSGAVNQNLSTFAKTATYNAANDQSALQIADAQYNQRLADQGARATALMQGSNAAATFTSGVGGVVNSSIGRASPASAGASPASAGASPAVSAGETPVRSVASPGAKPNTLIAAGGQVASSVGAAAAADAGLEVALLQNRNQAAAQIYNGYQDIAQRNANLEHDKAQTYQTVQSFEYGASSMAYGKAGQVNEGAARTRAEEAKGVAMSNSASGNVGKFAAAIGGSGYFQMGSRTVESGVTDMAALGWLDSNGSSKMKEKALMWDPVQGSAFGKIGRDQAELYAKFGPDAFSNQINWPSPEATKDKELRLTDQYLQSGAATPNGVPTNDGKTITTDPSVTRVSPAMDYAAQQSINGVPVSGPSGNNALNLAGTTPWGNRGAQNLAEGAAPRVAPLPRMPIPLGNAPEPQTAPAQAQQNRN